MSSSEGLSFFKIFGITTSISLIVSAIGYYRSPLDTVTIDLPPRVELKGPLKVNDVLKKGERILNGLAGPESIEVDENGNLYTGLLDGRIIKVQPSATGAIGEGLVEDIYSGPIKGVKPVDGHTKPRPLGIRLQGDMLFVVDAYYGLYSLNLKTKEVRPLVKPSDVEPPMKFLNDLDITMDGKFIFFTDTSYKWNLEKLYSDFLEGSCTGRVFRFEVKTGDIKTLASKLCFPNGVQLSDDEKTVAVTESTRFRVLFMNSKTGKVSDLTVLPAMPDNIRRSSAGGYWIAMPIQRSFLIDFFAERPMLRKIITGLMPMTWVPYFSATGSGIAAELDKSGAVVGSIHDVDGGTSHTVSEICETEDGILLAGSYKEPYMIKTKR